MPASPSERESAPSFPRRRESQRLHQGNQELELPHWSARSRALPAPQRRGWNSSQMTHPSPPYVSLHRGRHLAPMKTAARLYSKLFHSVFSLATFSFNLLFGYQFAADINQISLQSISHAPANHDKQGHPRRDPLERDRRLEPNSGGLGTLPQGQPERMFCRGSGGQDMR